MGSDLQAISPLDGRYARDLDALRAYFSEEALIRFRIRVELFHLKGLIHELELPQAASPVLSSLLNELEDRPELVGRVKHFEAATRHDVKAVEYALAEALEAAGHSDLVNWLHWGLTSEDVNNLAYAQMMTLACQEQMLPVLQRILKQLGVWIQSTSDIAMLSRTHGQAASPTTVGKEFAVFAARLQGELIHLHNLLPLGGKLNGATGNWHVFQAFFPDHDWLKYSESVIVDLGLRFEKMSTQIVVRESYVRVLDSLNRIAAIFIDLSRDCWQYISLGYFRLRKRSDTEVGSSTMPHKVNPVLFENAEGNLEFASSQLDFFGGKLLKSRLQRDLSDSTVLRNLGVALGHCLLAWLNLERGLKQLEPAQDVLAAELDRHWEVLAEPLQHALRLQGQEVPYDVIRKHTQGLQMGKAQWLQLLAALKLDLPVSSPSEYTGLASALAQQTVLEIDMYLNGQ